MADIEKVKHGLLCHSKSGKCSDSKNLCQYLDVYCIPATCADALSVIEELQAEIARLQPKTGKWIFTGQKNAYGGTVIQCPFCDDKYAASDPGSEHFCRNCGAKLAECFSPKDGEWDG